MAGEAGAALRCGPMKCSGWPNAATNATRQIDALVRPPTDQRCGGVDGAQHGRRGRRRNACRERRLTLEEIEQVSNQIASLVQNISASARNQSQSSQSVARNMQVLREISSQTADATSSTSDAIAKLAQLAAALRKSVAGFRLPEATTAPAVQPLRVITDADLAASTGSFRRVSGDLDG